MENNFTKEFSKGNENIFVNVLQSKSFFESDCFVFLLFDYICVPPSISNDNVKW